MEAERKKQEKKDKEKAKKFKKDQEEQQWKFEKKAETLEKVANTKKGLTKEYSHKMKDLGDRLEARVGGFGVSSIRQAMLPPKLKGNVST